MKLGILLVIGFLLLPGLVFAAPANGNGNKSVFEFVDNWSVDCDSDTVPDLWADISGWYQIRLYSENGNRNVELDVFHLDTVYSNGSGDTWVWRDRGPDRYYYLSDDDGVLELHLAITGRSAWNIIGHAVLNLETGEFELVAGQHPLGGDHHNFYDFWTDDRACEILF